MLVDDITVQVEAGAGGRGAVAFNKVPLMLGPTGGDGGRGGSVWFEGVADVNALMQYGRRQKFIAQGGKDGRGQFLDGADAPDLILKVPCGTRVTNLETGFVREVEHPGDRVLAAGGGEGGRGNFKFRSSTNTSPTEYEEGTPGDVATYRLELRLIADVGLVGLPNAGKSSLLNELTGARSKVAHYAFTTLEPHLGAWHGLIIADIPGLIEGASEGKGLGVKFLKHVERTRTLFHLVSADSEDPVRDWEAVRAELARYSPELAAKKEYVFLSKSDAATPEELERMRTAFKKKGVEATSLSILDEESMQGVKRILASLAR